MKSIRYSCRFEMKVEHLWHIFESNQVWDFMKTSSVGVELFLAYRQTTDRHDETNSWFSKFCGSAKLQTNIRVLSGIRTPDPSNSAAADLRLTPSERPPESTPSFVRTIKTRKFQWVRCVTHAQCVRYTSWLVFRECELKSGDFESVCLGGIINL